MIVEFARAKEYEGADPLTAVLEASRLRLRPILMTSFAFIAGVVPLVLATGAGAEMRHAMGIAVFAGMLGVTLFGLLLTPVFYVVVRRMALKRETARTVSIRMISKHNDGNGIMKIIFTGYRQTATLATLAFVTTLAGCTMAPKHERPASPTAMVYPYETSTVSGALDAA
ncbi:cation transport protein [Salmonella enterica subsp. indica]|uniref:Cation transport protein n=1 Tax=Salmonella enterica subsp. indica TaxID=59207 RepID=A0A379YIV4_SALER|nr:cation transport protein [Salmonella enterica subsp. indica]